MSLSIWLLIAQLLVSLIGGLIAAGIVLVVGGAGVISHLKKRLEVTEDQLGRVDDRLTRDQKTRSAAKGVEARVEKASIHEEAAARLVIDNAPAPLRMPGRTQGRR